MDPRERAHQEVLLPSSLSKTSFPDLQRQRPMTGLGCVATTAADTRLVGRQHLGSHYAIVGVSQPRGRVPNRMCTVFQTTWV